MLAAAHCGAEAEGQNRAGRSASVEGGGRRWLGARTRGSIAAYFGCLKDAHPTLGTLSSMGAYSTLCSTASISVTNQNLRRARHRACIESLSRLSVMGDELRISGSNRLRLGRPSLA